MAWEIIGITKRKSSYKVRVADEVTGRSFMESFRNGETKLDFINRVKQRIVTINSDKSEVDSIMANLKNLV